MRFLYSATIAAILFTGVMFGQAGLAVTTTALAIGQLNTPYLQTLNATGGTPPYSWSLIAGRLPNGLTLDSSTGQISGIPIGAPPADGGGQISSLNTVTFRVTDSAAHTATSNFTITIAASGLATGGPLEFITRSFPNGQVNTPYSQPLIANGGRPPYTFQILDGSLPSGLTLNASSGVISGVPTAAASPRLGFVVLDSTTPAQMATTSFRITILAGGPPQITTASLPGGTVNSAYSATLAATGGTPPYTWSAAQLPSGLFINASTGAISGIPTAAGTAPLAVTVTDSLNQTATANLSITTATALNLGISTASPLPSGTVNSFYSAILSATGGTAPYIWSAVGLPAGLSINAATGVISGTPTAAVANAQPTFKVIDSTSPALTAMTNLSLTINPQSSGGQLMITTTDPLPDAFIGAPYDVFLQAVGGTPPYTWSTVTGRLSPGLSLSDTGEISGTPPGPFVFDGNFSVTYRVTDRSGQTATKFLGVNVKEPMLHFLSTTLPNGQTGIPYSQQLMTQFGSMPLTFSIVTGTLPSGLSLNAATGVISGTPTAPLASGKFVFKVTDASSPAQIDIETFTLTITSGTSGPAITTASLPDGTVNSAYSATLTATGGATPYIWSASGLPAGLSINSSTGVIGGTPGTAGTSAVTVSATDASSRTATANLSISIAPAVSFGITTVSPLPSGTANSFYSAMVGATGGTAPYTWSAAGLPSGLLINPATGVISGVPVSIGTSSATVTVTDSTNPTHLTSTKNLQITIGGGALAITTTSLNVGRVDMPYSQMLTAAGGTPPYSWSILAGRLQRGLTLDASTGVISGTPTGIAPADGGGRIVSESSLTFHVTDSASHGATATFTLLILGPGN